MQKFALPIVPVDGGSLVSWCQANVSGYVNGHSDSQLSVIKNSAWTSDQITAVKTYIATLTESGEATKLALPHNLTGSAKATFEAAVTAKIATLTWDTMSPAQRTFSMGGTLSNTDYDSLPTS
jgi:hypothetical protein